MIEMNPLYCANFSNPFKWRLMVLGSICFSICSLGCLDLESGLLLGHGFGVGDWIFPNLFSLAAWGLGVGRDLGPMCCNVKPLVLFFTN